MLYVYPEQVILTKDHDADAKCTIFHNDVRAYGKDFERYYERTQNLPGIRFFRSYPSIVKEDPVTHNVTIRYTTPEDGVIEEEFDMVVLSIGMNPPKGVEEMAKQYGIELEEHNFCKLDPTNPMLTNRPGIFVSGALQGPIDIPESVFSASGAGSQIGEMLKYRRGNLAKERIYPRKGRIPGRAPDRCFCLPLRCKHRQDRRCPRDGGVLQDPSQRRLRPGAALLLRDQLGTGDNGQDKGRGFEPGGCRCLLSEDPGAPLQRYPARSGDQSVLL
jgi:hypothetical protein